MEVSRAVSAVDSVLGVSEWAQKFCLFAVVSCHGSLKVLAVPRQMLYKYVCTQIHTIFKTTVIKRNNMRPHSQAWWAGIVEGEVNCAKEIPWG